MPWVEDRIGTGRARQGAYAWRALLDSGALIPGGSDAPVESVNPLLGIYAACTRQDLRGNPAGGWFPEQCMTREEAIRAYTVHGACAGFEEGIKGSLQPGKLADFVVLDRDILEVPVDEIPKARVLMTVVGGVEVEPERD